MEPTEFDLNILANFFFPLIDSLFCVHFLKNKLLQYRICICIFKTQNIPKILVKLFLNNLDHSQKFYNEFDCEKKMTELGVIIVLSVQCYYAHKDNLLTRQINFLSAFYYRSTIPKCLWFYIVCNRKFSKQPFKFFDVIKARVNKMSYHTPSLVMYF